MQAKLKHHQEKYNAGDNDTQENSAMSDNLLCDKLAIKHKNAKINTDLDEIQQVTDMHYLRKLFFLICECELSV